MVSSRPGATEVGDWRARDRPASKTAISLAWALSRSAKPSAGVACITSGSNRGFVEDLGVDPKVVTYDDLRLDDSAVRVADVDVAGNGAATSAAHVALGE